MPKRAVEENEEEVAGQMMRLGKDGGWSDRDGDILVVGRGRGSWNDEATWLWMEQSSPRGRMTDFMIQSLLRKRRRLVFQDWLSTVTLEVIVIITHDAFNDYVALDCRTTAECRNKK